MKTSALLSVSYIVASSTFSEVFCLPRSLELSRRWHFTRSVDLSRTWPSKRSPSPSMPLCQLGRRSASEARSSSSEERNYENKSHSCTKSIDSVETDDYSDSSRKGSHKTGSGSSSAHSSKPKVSTSNPSHSIFQRSWKSTDFTQSHKKSGYHSTKYKSHYFHHKSHPAAKYASAKNTQYSGSPVKYNHMKGYTSSMDYNQSPVNTTESGANDTGSQANNSGNTLNDIISVDNNIGSAVSNPGSTVHNPASEDLYTNLDGSNGIYQGKATFFYQEGSPGACGKVHDDSAFIVAIQSKMYDGGKYCGQTVMITRKSTGKTITAIVADECPGCPTHQSLDLSVGAFSNLGVLTEGIFDIDWIIRV